MGGGFGLCGVSRPHASLPRPPGILVAEWDRAGLWAKEHTAPDAVFLMPTWYFRGAVGRTEPGSVQDEAVLNAGTFQYSSQRRVWVDFRNGAAVMWFPSYYDEWHRKVVEVNRLTGPDQEATYARKNGITYIIDVCSAGKPGTLQHATEISSGGPPVIMIAEEESFDF